jgi:hypothetical protein
MILEHGKEPVSARWDKEVNSWNIGQHKIYRWLDSNNKPASDWFRELNDALDWIKEHDNI